jgi:hypothetical protein
MMFGVLGAVLILSPMLAAAAQVLMSGNVQLTTLPSVRRDYAGWGLVDVTGSGPATMVVPRSFFQNNGGAFRVFPTNPNVAQVTSSFTSYNVTETLRAGGGPGSFVFCPGVNNPANPNCTNPSQATGGQNNFVQYTPTSPNQFGGTFRVLQKNFNSSVSFRVGTNPSKFSHQAGTTMTNVWPGGGVASSTQVLQRAGGVLTSNPVLGPDGSIQTPGPVTGTGAVPNASLWTGFPATTGMVVHKDTNPSPFTTTLTGSDMRTPLGSGQITLVGSGLAQSSNGTDFGREITVTIVPEPGATLMFAAGIVGLAGLYSQRRRLF